MKKYLFSAVFVFAIYGVSNKVAYGQDGYKIYQMVVDSVYNSTKQGIVAINEKIPLDPINYDTTGLIYENVQTPYFIYLDSEVSTYSSPEQFMNMFPKLTKAFGLKSLTYTLISKSVITHWGTSSNYCLKLTKNSEPINYDTFYYCGITGKNMGIRPTRYTLYGIFIASDRKTALLQIKITPNPNNAVARRLGIILKKKGKSWKIAKMEYPNS